MELGLYSIIIYFYLYIDMLEGVEFSDLLEH